MIYYTDGYCLQRNPSNVGGGFTVVSEDGDVYTEQVLKNGFTNNEAELLGIHYAVNNCEMYDTIITDSEIAIKWLSLKHLKKKKRKRKDLDSIKVETIELIKDKFIELLWRPREENWAGHFNEEKGYDNWVSEFKTHILNKKSKKKYKFKDNHRDSNTQKLILKSELAKEQIKDSRKRIKELKEGRLKLFNIK